MAIFSLNIVVNYLYARIIFEGIVCSSWRTARVPATEPKQNLISISLAIANGQKYQTLEQPSNLRDSNNFLRAA
ncbi:hypothetical protein [Moorena producens]|uniref:hypothetical protein n=1 Tax=Moorena producens TaxID=1155739 RepID=UPI003C715EAF